MGGGVGGGISETLGVIIGWHSTDLNDVVSGESFQIAATGAAMYAASGSLSMPTNIDGSFHHDPYFNRVPKTIYFGGGAGLLYAGGSIGKSFFTPKSKFEILD
jgi:hypothetical protein